MYDYERMIRELRHIAEKESNKHRNTFEICVDAMALDSANALEELLEERNGLKLRVEFLSNELKNLTGAKTFTTNTVIVNSK